MTATTEPAAGIPASDAAPALPPPARARVCSRVEWPPNYVEAFRWRQHQIRMHRERPALVPLAREYYRTRPVEFITDWCVTYDPRNAGSSAPTTMPFIPFDRQAEFVVFLHELVKAQSNGLVEKARDMGATWLSCAFSVWLWLFWPGASIGWGSRKQELVDRLGDADSIFEKMRQIIRLLPEFFKPEGFNEKDHMPFMRLLNPENGATITGEVGDNIGRGGRKLMYFKDEAQPLDARVMTPAGWRVMGDLAVGDHVTGPDGAPRRIIGVNDCGEHDIFRVSFSDGTSTRCSPNHLWTVDRVVGKRQRMTLRTHELASSFAYTSPGGQMQYRYRVPVTAPIEFAEPSPYPLDPYLVGALLGDGSLGDVPAHSPKITTIDPETVEQFRRLLPKGCTITQEAGRITWRLGDEGGRRGWKHKSRSRLAVVAAGIAGMRSGDKRVPPAYLFGPAAVRLAVLQGLMDADGSAANGGSCSFHTASPGLAEDVRFIVESLGGTATLNVKRDARGFLDQHVLHLNLPSGVLPFRLSRKLAAMKPRRHPPGRTIVAVEPCGRGPVRCISVDALDGLYLTDHLIVTHNSAHYARPELIEAALGDTTRVQVDISSVNGLGNVFHRKREAGKEWPGAQRGAAGWTGAPVLRGTTNVFVMDWRDHPAKTQAWYDERRRDYIDKGLSHIFSQEVDRDYAASVEGVIIPAAWVTAAIDAHLVLGLDDDGRWYAGLDVADDGGDTNAEALRKGVFLKDLDEWGDADIGETARRAIERAGSVGQPIELEYDSIGIGAGVKAEANRLATERKLPKGVTLVPWSASAAAINPDEHVIKGDKQSPLNKDFYANLKAQGWWELRLRFERTYRAVTEPGFTYKKDELIVLPSNLRKLHQLRKELSQATRDQDGKGRLVVNKSPPGTKSPNLADSVVQAFWPVPYKNNVALFAAMGR